MNKLIRMVGIFQQQDVAAGSSVAPTVVSVQEQILGLVTDHPVPLGPTIANGDLLIIWVATDGGSTQVATTSASGWTAISDFSTTVAGAAVFKKLADGTEGGTSISLMTPNSENMASQVFRIQTWSGNINDVVVATPSTSSTATNHTPPALTSGWGAVPTLWMCGVCTSATNTLTSGPSGYTIVNTGNTGATSDAQMRTGYIQTTAASETPGAFVYSTGTATKRAVTIAIRGT